MSGGVGEDRGAIPFRRPDPAARVRESILADGAKRVGRWDLGVNVIRLPGLVKSLFQLRNSGQAVVSVPANRLKLVTEQANWWNSQKH